MVSSFWPKNLQKYYKDFCPESFQSFLGVSWKLFGTSCKLPYKWHYLLSPKKAPKSFQEAPKKLQKIQGRNLYNISVAILVRTMTPKRHFETNWPLACLVYSQSSNRTFTFEITHYTLLHFHTFCLTSTLKSMILKYL